MDVEKAKLFVGGISRETSEEALRAHFSKYGNVLGSLVAKDKAAGNPRGFGFVWFSDPSFADVALLDTHVILGRKVEVKKAIPRSEQNKFQQEQKQPQQNHPNQQKNLGFGKMGSNDDRNDHVRTKKIFVGGLSANLTEEQFKKYFEKFGKIIDVVVMQDSSTNRPRGFGFVTFDSEESVDKVMQNTFHELNGRLVEVKRAVPKDKIKSSYSSYAAQGSVRGSSDKSSEHVNYLLPGTSYEMLSVYPPFEGYSGVGGYPYGTSLYGSGYPTVGYSRPGFGVMPIFTRSPWSGPVMVGGPGVCPLPYNGGGFYPAYMNVGAGIMGATAGYNGMVGPFENRKLNQAFDGYGHMPPDHIPPPTEAVRVELDCLSLKSDGRGARS
uniref:Uncharacterized protein MANES_18G049700 n=1 Tax=Rhizophora mucronata TaxID=61149 RepID=A0A2P2LE55_RHIMU